MKYAKLFLIDGMNINLHMIHDYWSSTRGRNAMVVRFASTNAIISYHN